MALIIGNLISFVGACFTMASSCSKDFKRIYLYQTFQCFTLAFANIFFASTSGLTTLFLCGVRNLMVAYHKYDKKSCAVFLVLITVAGIAANNRGLIGLIPVVTTVIYTVGCLVCKKTTSVKINTIQNLIMWAIYDVFIGDYVSIAVDSVSAAAAVGTLFKIKKEEAKNEA